MHVEVTSNSFKLTLRLNARGIYFLLIFIYLFLLIKKSTKSISSAAGNFQQKHNKTNQKKKYEIQYIKYLI